MNCIDDMMNDPMDEPAFGKADAAMNLVIQNRPDLDFAEMVRIDDALVSSLLNATTLDTDISALVRAENIPINALICAQEEYNALFGDLATDTSAVGLAIANLTAYDEDIMNFGTQDELNRTMQMFPVIADQL